MEKDLDIQFMRRCFQLAEKGLGNTAPNPLVGAVIVYQNTIIGEGYHKKYGQSHAEPNAIKSVKNKHLLSDSTLYVNLEPCNHFGNTPPCADLIVENKFKRVVIANTDPNPKVNGSGIQKLKDAGIKITTGVLELEGNRLNRRFFIAQTKKRPYIILKWAQSSNGFIDALDDSPLQISNSRNQQLVHNWRSQEDGILVGAQTFIKDAPSLNTRHIHGKSPIPILLVTKDTELNFTLWRDTRKLLVIAPTKPTALPENTIWIALKPILSDTISELLKFNINSILIEGGSKTHQYFIDENLWDELRVSKSKMTIKTGIKAASWGQQTASFETVQNDNVVNYFFNNRQDQ